MFLISRSGIVMVMLSLAINGSIFGQTWDFNKEKDGIKVYTRRAGHTSLKSFKGEAILHTQMDKVCQLIGNGENFDWWDEGIRELKVLDYVKDKYIKYYLVYDVPWPLADRDLCVEANIYDDPLTGQRIVIAKPLPDIMPLNPNYIRIRNYSQKWIVTPIDKNTIKLTLEGFVDPGGIVPSWLYNMVITDTPIKVIKKVKARVE